MERRKNIARKKSTDITYLVDHDPTDGRWNVTRNDKPTGGYGRDKSTAIGLAYQQASLEQAGSTFNVTVWSVQGGSGRRNGRLLETQKAPR